MNYSRVCLSCNITLSPVSVWDFSYSETTDSTHQYIVRICKCSEAEQIGCWNPVLQEISSYNTQVSYNFTEKNQKKYVSHIEDPVIVIGNVKKMGITITIKHCILPKREEYRCDLSFEPL